MNPIVVRNLKIGEGMPKICVPLVGETSEIIIEEAKKVADTSADMVEWRVDWFEGAMNFISVKEVLRSLREVIGELPLLFTFRTKQEGGEKEITFSQYAMLLKAIASTHLVDLIDVEVYLDEQIPELIEELKRTGVIVVGSNHDFEKTPQKREIVQTLGYMQFIGADIPKIAVMPQSKNDVLVLLSATDEMVSKYADRPIVTMSMADTGTISRILGEVFGSAITFGAMENASAPGQIQVSELKKALETIHSVLPE